MELKKFTSPREEALELTYQTIKDILDGKKDVVSILRYCLVIAKNLRKNEIENWIMSELSGYDNVLDVPDYRIMGCPYEDKDGIYNRELRETLIEIEIHLLDSKLRRNENLRLLRKDGSVSIIDPVKIERVISPIIDKCLFFLNDVKTELQYGGVIQYLIEEIRNKVDEKLSSLDKNISDEIDSLYLNLSSSNPADWPKVAHSCRRILKFVADFVFPLKEENYKMKDGREIEVKEQHFINRLCAFIDQKANSGQRKLLLAEINYLEAYLRQIVEFSQMGEHNKSISKFDASMIATHTYLIVSDILKLVPNSKTSN